MEDLNFVLQGRFQVSWFPLFLDKTLILDKTGHSGKQELGDSFEERLEVGVDENKFLKTY